MKRVLLLGASGFIGRHILQGLKDAQVDSIVCLGRQNKPTSGDPWVRHDLITGSLEELTEIVRQARPDVVINGVGSLAGDLLHLVNANVVVIAKVMEAMFKAAPQARFVKLGSAGEYGVVEQRVSVNEDAPTHPVSAYGVTRLASAQLVALAKAEGHLDGVVLRVFNPIGAGLSAENMLGRAAIQMRQALAEGRGFIQMGPLGAYRDFVDVRDVARAVVGAALAPKLEVPILNVAGGKAVQSRELVELLAQTAGFKGEIRETNPAPSRSASVNWIQADIRRIAQVLGWSPKYSLRDSVETVWNEISRR